MNHVALGLQRLGYRVNICSNVIRLPLFRLDTEAAFLTVIPGRA
jgi:hypothetical protein